jgi:hypothetical protein
MIIDLMEESGKAPNTGEDKAVDTAYNVLTVKTNEWFWKSVKFKINVQIPN